jgi:hypothetical protein
MHLCCVESAPGNLLLRRLSQNLMMPLLRKVHPHGVLLLICLIAVLLTFVLAGAIVKPVVASFNVGAKDSGHGGAHVDAQVTGVVSAFTQDPPVQSETIHTHEASVCDIALVSGRTGAVNHDTVCSLLTECLQDVSSIVFTLHLVLVY